MRLLFIAHYPGYLRYFDSAVKLLAERGNLVYLAFELPHKQREGLQALGELTPEQASRVVLLPVAPARRDGWRTIARDVRSTIDFARYLHPRYAKSPYLRSRMAEHVPPAARWLTRIPALPPRLLSRLLDALLVLEHAIPSSEEIEAFLRELRPDALLLSPLVTDGSRQTDYVKSARALGIPCGLLVASWDHLTTKGLIRLAPHRVVVWNEQQRQEAVEMHRVAASDVAVTGAQPFDRWFDRTPSTSRAEFAQKVGLASTEPFLLFVGSTASISAPDAELRFVREWARTIRDRGAPNIRRLPIVVRPHPYNPGLWRDAELSDVTDAVVWPRHDPNPVDERDRAEYFDSLHHSAAVIGVNTSAMIEAAIVGRPVLSLLAPEFAPTQEGTLHFRYLLPENGGFLRIARSLDEHLAQLADVIANPSIVAAETGRFVDHFVRPNGRARACTPIVADVVEEIARLGPLPPEPYRRQLYPFQWAMRLLGGLGRLREPIRSRATRLQRERPEPL